MTATTRRVQELGKELSIAGRAGQLAARSKAQLRTQIQQAQNNAIEELKLLSINTGLTNGKLLVFQAEDKVDSVFSSLATSLISGSLSRTEVYCMKVAPRTINGKPESERELCRGQRAT
ncbi:hypothetical protein BDY24DRAFT_217755 [Mrakia frigida]|uniref:uncharacterized protein n=1 Tax=Mrakia frigida TaxID=29902 RepID=UPI003FCC2413